MQRSARTSLSDLQPYAGRPVGLTALAVLAALLCAVPAQAQWKWRNAQGAVQYSDMPPPAGVPDKDVLARPASSLTVTLRPAGGAASAPVTPNAANAGMQPTAAASAASRPDGKRDTEEAAARRQAEENARAQAENCRRAREYARTLESGMRVARLNDKGEREVIDDAQRQKELARSRDVISSNCR
jgi:hypothetical protein